MSPKKGTRAHREEYIYVHYGIEMNSLEVHSVWEQRDGRLVGGMRNHHVMPGRRADSELVIVFNLSEIRTLPVSMLATDGDKVQQELREIAARKLAEREANKTDASNLATDP